MLNSFSVHPFVLISLAYNIRASDILEMKNPTQYYGPVNLVDKELGLNGTYHRWDAVMSTRYKVSTEGV